MPNPSLAIALLAAHRERMQRSEDIGVVATSTNRVDGRVSVSTTSQFKPPSAPTSLSSSILPISGRICLLGPLKELLVSLGLHQRKSSNWPPSGHIFISK
jgi:hypothetical protein